MARQVIHVLSVHPILPVSYYVHCALVLMGDRIPTLRNTPLCSQCVAAGRALPAAVSNGDGVL